MERSWGAIQGSSTRAAERVAGAAASLREARRTRRRGDNLPSMRELWHFTFIFLRCFGFVLCVFFVFVLFCDSLIFAERVAGA